MFRFLMSVVLISVSVAGFLVVTKPLYEDISTLKAQAASYDEALNNAKALENERDKLTKKYNNILPENLDKIKKLLPDNVDNIRLILEIEKIALPYGMALKDVRYDTFIKKTANNTSPSGESGVIQGGSSPSSSKDYGEWSLEFSTQGTYNNFLNFLKDLETNLRIVDIASIQFSADAGGGGVSPGLAESYKYSFKIKTYWLKD